MKLQTISALWLMLIAGLLIHAGKSAADSTDTPASSLSGENAVSAAKDLPDFNSMTTELKNRSVVMEKELIELCDLPAIQERLVRMAKETKSISRNLKLFKHSSQYGYDALFDVNARVDQQANDLNDIIRTTDEAVSQAERLKKEWQEEGRRWEQLQSSLAKQVASQALGPTFAKVRHIIAGSQGRIGNVIESLTAQRQVAEVIRASHSSLDIELDALIAGLRDNLMCKTTRSMFSSKYYSQLRNGFKKELPIRLRSLSMPDVQFLRRWGWLFSIQASFSILLGIAIIRQRRRLMEREQWQFIARRPVEVGIFVAAITMSSFYGAIPGPWRLLALGVVILSLARLVIAFIGDTYQRRCFVYGLSAYLIAIRSFGVFDMPPSLFRLYIFSTALVGIHLCLWRSAASARRGDARFYMRALRFGALLFLLILIAEMGGYSALSAHLLESSLKTILIALAGWMLAVMQRGFLEFIIDSAFLKKIAFIQIKADHIVNRSAMLTHFFSAMLTGAFILVAWRIYSNPVEAIQEVWSFGIGLGPRRVSVGLVLSAAVLLYCAFFLSWTVQVILMDGLFTRRQLQVGVRISMARLVHYGFVCLGFFLALLTLGVQLRDFTIVAGALGVGIGFGLQNIINNFVSGLILLFERPIKVGDFVELDAQQVEIKKNGLRSTVVQAFDRSEIVVPNNDLTANKVTNWTLSDPFAGIRIPVRVACDSDVPQVMHTLLTCAQAHARVVAHPSAKVFFMGFGESSLDFELQGWIADVEKMIQIKSELYQEIDRQFRSLAIRVPFPQHDLHVNPIRKPLSDASGGYGNQRLNIPAYQADNA